MKEDPNLVPCAGFLSDHLTPCQKVIHHDCFLDLVATSSLNCNTSISDPHFHMKTCWTRFDKVQTKKNSPVNKSADKVFWATDGSIDVLMEWLTTEGNYQRFKSGGDKNKGGDTKDGFKKEAERKTTICQEIAKLINDKPGTKKRNWKAVARQIAYLENRFRTIHDRTKRTGEGREDGPGDYFADLNKEFPYYSALSKTFISNGTFEIPLCSDNFYGSSDDEASETNFQVKKEKDKKFAPKNTSAVQVILPEGIVEGQQEKLEAETRKLKVETVSAESKREAVNRKLEADARCAEEEAKLAASNAMAKNKKLQEEAQAAAVRTRMAEMDAIVHLMTLRKKMKKDGFSEEEIDQALPMKNNSN